MIAEENVADLEYSPQNFYQRNILFKVNDSVPRGLPEPILSDSSSELSLNAALPLHSNGRKKFSVKLDKIQVARSHQSKGQRLEKLSMTDSLSLKNTPHPVMSSMNRSTEDEVSHDTSNQASSQRRQSIHGLSQLSHIAYKHKHRPKTAPHSDIIRTVEEDVIACKEIIEKKKLLFNPSDTITAAQKAKTIKDAKHMSTSKRALAVLEHTKETKVCNVTDILNSKFAYESQYQYRPAVTELLPILAEKPALNDNNFLPR